MGVAISNLRKSSGSFFLHNQSTENPYLLAAVNSLRENWLLERDVGGFGWWGGQQLQSLGGAEAGVSGGNRLAERQLPIE